jgi:hypothetical protein
MAAAADIFRLRPRAMQQQQQQLEFILSATQAGKEGICLPGVALDLVGGGGAMANGGRPAVA